MADLFGSTHTPEWMSPGVFSLESEKASESIGRNFSQSFNAAAQRKQEQAQFDAMMPLKVQQANLAAQETQMDIAGKMLENQNKSDLMSDRLTFQAAQSAWIKGDSSIAPQFKSPATQTMWENWKADTMLGHQITNDNTEFNKRLSTLPADARSKVMAVPRGKSLTPSPEQWGALGVEENKTRDAAIQREKDMETFKENLKHGPDVSGLSEDNRKTALDLFQRLNAEPAVKQFQVASASHESMKNQVISSRKDPTGANDISIIFSYMKSIDPQSTVREGEFATAQQSGGIPQNIVAQYNKILSGERLTQEQRENFLKTSERSMDAYAKSANEVRQRYLKQGGNYGIGEKFISEAPYSITKEIPANQFQSVSDVETALKGGKVKIGDVISVYDPQTATYKKKKIEQ